MYRPSDRDSTIADLILCTSVHVCRTHYHTQAALRSSIIIFKELFISMFSPGTVMHLTRGSHCAIWSPNVARKIPGCFTSPLMNISATQQLTLSDRIFSPQVVVVVHAMAVMSSSGCQKGSACSCGGSPPEPVTLLVSMAVLQAAPQAGCVQGPIQPVFSAAAPLMFSPGAGAKLPNTHTHTQKTHTWSSLSSVSFARICKESFTFK